VQSDLVERLSSSADRVIDTSGTIDETRLLVERAYTEALKP
jgi:hypothetical protein